MGVERIIYPNRLTWLESRGSGIGASEIGTVMGYTPKTPLRLWQEKIGAVAPEDLSQNERVQFGNAAEDVLREMFCLLHPEYELEFEPFTVLRQSGEYNFLFYTPDGLLTERDTGRKGLYESKTATLLNKADRDKWWERIPDNYFCQICQGMFCGNLDFAVVFSLLRDREGDAALRAYKFEREDCEWMIDDVKSSGRRFWDCVLKGIMPTMPLFL